MIDILQKVEITFSRFTRHDAIPPQQRSSFSFTRKRSLRNRLNISDSDDQFVFQKQVFFQSETCIWRQIIYFFIRLIFNFNAVKHLRNYGFWCYLNCIYYHYKSPRALQKNSLQSYRFYDF